MIGYLEGTLFKKSADRILLLVNQVGYEVVLPAFVMQTMETRAEGDPVCFYIYYYQTERQPKPVLFGFTTPDEKDFFQLLITVEKIGPLKAAQFMTMPVSDMAAAIEAGDVSTLNRLKGVGARTAQKIIATLGGKTGRFIVDEQQMPAAPENDMTQLTTDVLVEQLGYRVSDARDMIQKALQRNPDVSTPEQLFDEIFRPV
ncbi:MAG: Holliday junction branch migration protein RuvA [Thermodesulfobacteriota bacterium]|nr:Holliday junction branch migration protein RuvA [Thermodesulfobacteriota bacterium]